MFQVSLIYLCHFTTVSSYQELSSISFPGKSVERCWKEAKTYSELGRIHCQDAGNCKHQYCRPPSRIFSHYKLRALGRSFSATPSEEGDLGQLCHAQFGVCSVRFVIRT